MRTDYGTLNLVFAPQWGLQVLSGADSISQAASLSSNESFESLADSSHIVQLRPACAVVNVTDVLRFLTGDRLKPAVHRVLPLPDVDPYFVTYFLRPSDYVEFVDGQGRRANVMDWYDRKTNRYEALFAAQGR